MARMSTLAAVAERVAQGHKLQPADASLVLESHDLVAIGALADEVRRQRHGADTTFVRVFEAHPDAIPSSLPANVAAGEFRISGQPASASGAIAAVAALRKLAGAAPLFGFSLADLEDLAAPSTFFADLKGAGLDGIADTPVDRLQSAASIQAARAAGLLVLRLTVDSIPADLLQLMSSVEAIVRDAGGFQAFAPLPRRVPVASPTTGYDDVKSVALARLLLDVPSIQVDWPLYGPKLAQVGLLVGADDIDGVVAAEPGTLGPRRTALEEVRGNIVAAGLQAVERDGRFARLAVDGDRT
jgi:aminodeoxyfutalosine synthase